MADSPSPRGASERGAKSARDAGGILALDIGSGTQDALLWLPGTEAENSVQLVLPSPTTMLARVVRGATVAGVDVHLSGTLMGGGPVCWAAQDHIKAGRKVSAEPDAALTFHDNLDSVREMGVTVTDSPPVGAMDVRMGDIREEAFSDLFNRFVIDPPTVWLVAVQDHGRQPHGSNRAFRFSHWETILAEGVLLQKTLYEKPPEYLTRMTAVLNQLEGVARKKMVTDTGLAAIHGALCDERVRPHIEGGILVVNLGNQHTLAALIKGDRILGLFEHHTGALSTDSLARWMDRFRTGDVTKEEVMNDGGHGAAYHPEVLGAEGLGGIDFDAVAVTGPRRALAKELVERYGWITAAPFGNMMLAGCFGLVRAYHLADGSDWP